MNQRDKGVMLATMNRGDRDRILAHILKNTTAIITELQPGPFDLVTNISRPIPLSIVDQYFGFPGPSRTEMLRWSKATQLDAFFNVWFNQLPESGPIHTAALEALIEMKEYIIQLIKERKAEIDQDPTRDDILCRLLKTSFPSEIGFGFDRVVINVGGLLIGSLETSSMAIAHTLEQIFSRPAHLARARASAQLGDTDAILGYVLESLRFKPFLPYLFRKLSVDYTVAKGFGQEFTIPSGTTVLLVTTASMFDPMLYSTPFEFQPNRARDGYLLFGKGHHRCLGEHIAGPMVAETVRLLLNMKNLRPIAPIDRCGGPFPEEYMLTFDA